MLDRQSNTHFSVSVGQDEIDDDRTAFRSKTKKSNDATLPAVGDELAGIKGKLGFVNTMIVDRRINREAKKILAEGYMQLIEAKKQELMAKIAIGLSESKKNLLLESLRVSGEIDKEIAELSAQFSAQMVDGVLLANFTAAQEEQIKLDAYEEAFKGSKLSESRYQQLRGATNEATDLLINIMKNNVSQIIQAHVSHIKLALEIFRERVISKGGF
jgi:hypothetical protein